MPIPAGDGTTLPPWAPTLDEVAAYTASRTIVPGSGGTNIELAQFSADTHPTATQVAFFIRDACAWILIATGPLDESLESAAAACATIYSAAMVERRYLERQAVNRDNAITTARDLYAEAVQMRQDIRLRNDVLVGGQDAATFQVLPVWNFSESSDLASFWCWNP